jgi:nickel-type superoxide dismutase maturation protease
MPEPTDLGPSLASEPPPPMFHRWSSRRVRVEDESMLPTLRPGDRLRVDPRIYRQRPPRAGEIVILVDPEDASRWLVKRVIAVDPSAGTMEVRGDAPETARDSRQFGPVPTRSVIGRVWERYYPLNRRCRF